MNRLNKLKRIFVVGLLTVFLIMLVGLLSAYANGKKIIGEPQVSWVSHTEYWSSDGPGADEVASTIIRLTDYKGDPFSVDSCSATILYPDKTAYLSNQAMSPSAIAGNWYRSDPVPAVEGTYEQQVTCTYGGGKTIKTSQSFHVNPALNFLKTIDYDVVAASTKLSHVNLTITGKVDQAEAAINTNIDSAETTLRNVMEKINSSLSTQLSQVDGNTNTRLTDLQITIEGKIKDSNESIQSRISLAEGNLKSLMDSVNSNLSNKLTSAESNLDSALTNVKLNLTGVMNDVKATVVARVDLAETNLNSLINTVNNDLSNQLTNAKADLSSQLRDVNVSLIGQLGSTQTAIQTQLSNVETSVSSLMNTLTDEVKDYLGKYLPTINNTANKIYEDSQWLVSNAMNQHNNSEIISRFNSVDGNLSVIEGFCSNLQTSNSLLCQDVSNIKNVLATTRQEQTDYFNELNETTTNTWNLLSGSIASNIDEILENLGVVRAQTTDINATLHAMKDDQESRVYASIIS